jgi:hypothetical protein
MPRTLRSRLDGRRSDIALPRKWSNTEWNRKLIPGAWSRKAAAFPKSEPPPCDAAGAGCFRNVAGYIQGSSAVGP